MILTLEEVISMIECSQMEARHLFLFVFIIKPFISLIDDEIEDLYCHTIFTNHHILNLPTKFRNLLCKQFTTHMILIWQEAFFLH